MVNIGCIWMYELVNMLVYLHLPKKAEPDNSSVANHLLFYKYSSSYDNFTVLTRETNKTL